MARVRMAEPKLQSYEEAALHLKEIGELEIALTRIEADMNAKISDIKLQASLEAEPIKARIELLARELKEFAEFHKADFTDERTRVFPWGQFGFRKSTKIVIRSIKNTLAALKARGMHDCIIVEERINRDQLKQYPEDVIAAVGAVKHVEDTFWYEVDHEKLQE